ncbi:hypothetical protein NEMIN01_1480 [Nematocida minor]|uniref:uncharacterized protein n=1 Tax=Nematocida minor TaxID=1912983 RepID=UPI0022206804|nr:uncharacterized protein NEMIN01_1480 [Nematocida minor]KAI5191321.1 hypothetical protein NEMIN01_1480 [Nematocida minor]
MENIRKAQLSEIASSVREDSSTSSNDRVEEDGLLDMLKGANKGLAGSLKTSKDTTKTLKSQGKKLDRSLKKKKKIRKSIDEDEKITQKINSESHLIMLKGKFFDSVRNFFSSNKKHNEAVDKAAQEEEDKAKEDRASEDDSFSSEDEEIEKRLEETDSDASIDDELEKTLAGLQSLRRSVHSQTQRIKSQTHATKEMRILDKDTVERSKKLKEEVKKIN